MPSDQALLVERFADKVWLLTVDPRAFWPSESRVAFYVTGNYEGTLPAGRVRARRPSHGPEYRVYHAFIDRPKKRGHARIGQPGALCVIFRPVAGIPETITST